VRIALAIIKKKKRKKKEKKRKEKKKERKKKETRGLDEQSRIQSRDGESRSRDSFAD